jgi:hypothetical protein
MLQPASADHASARSRNGEGPPCGSTRGRLHPAGTGLRLRWQYRLRYAVTMSVLNPIVNGEQRKLPVQATPTPADFIINVGDPCGWIVASWSTMFALLKPARSFASGEGCDSAAGKNGLVMF